MFRMRNDEFPVKALGGWFFFFWAGNKGEIERWIVGEIVGDGDNDDDDMWDETLGNTVG